MPYFETIQEWLDQSSLLLEARPTTTRVTTKYSIKPVKPRAAKPKDQQQNQEQQQQQDEQKQAGGGGDSTKAAAAAAAAAAGTSSSTKPPRGSLVFKTYDPVSGTTLKYRTTKAQEVSRLMGAALGRLGKGMAALPAETTDEAMPDAAAAASGAGGRGGGDEAAGKAGSSGPATPALQPQQQPQGGAGGGKKKKRSKR
ncbi:hypothetical protein JDV02_000274 [Purpureocillium takamizusanense]|uniref:SRP9 domain-containing protein n=1 Tax=Purpureocillium takamizusanense TaxID=2060973 RepID=A0A9Q8Q4G6_9HYPO|nr:uncharacterized protein JDV02_000274 [Purpureocillium takamizusanense]UNI13538.1 hypothetical protein JDV02_000274 [Purpureocillium takamizusanense]